MGMSSPKTKAEARERIAKLQGDIARKKANLAYHKSQHKSGYAKAYQGNEMMDIANMKAEIAELRAKIPSLP